MQCKWFTYYIVSLANVLCSVLDATARIIDSTDMDEQNKTVEKPEKFGSHILAFSQWDQFSSATCIPSHWPLGIDEVITLTPSHLSVAILSQPKVAIYWASFFSPNKSHSLYSLQKKKRIVLFRNDWYFQL